jgi:hypothetical protein
MLGVVTIRDSNEPPPTPRQLLDRAGDAWKVAHKRAGNKASYRAMLSTVKQMLSGDQFKAWQAELLWWDGTSKGAIRVGLVFLVGAQVALDRRDHNEFLYLISKCYYYLGVASGPETFVERSAKGGSTKAKNEGGDEQRAVLTWLKDQKPRSFNSLRGIFTEMVKQGIVADEGDVGRRLYGLARRSEAARKAFSRVSTRRLTPR